MQHRTSHESPSCGVLRAGSPRALSPPAWSPANSRRELRWRPPTCALTPVGLAVRKLTSVPIVTPCIDVGLAAAELLRQPGVTRPRKLRPRGRLRFPGRPSRPATALACGDSNPAPAATVAGLCERCQSRPLLDPCRVRRDHAIEPQDNVPCRAGASGMCPTTAHPLQCRSTGENLPRVARFALRQDDASITLRVREGGGQSRSSRPSA